MHADALRAHMHDSRNLFYPVSQKHHLHNHIGVGVFIVKMVVQGVEAEGSPAQALQTCGGIRDFLPGSDPDQKPEHQIGQFLHEACGVRLPTFRKPGAEDDVRRFPCLVCSDKLPVDLLNIAYIMLSVGVHLNHIRVAVSQRILISHLQSAAVAEIEDMGDHLAMML